MFVNTVLAGCKAVSWTPISIPKNERLWCWDECQNSLGPDAFVWTPSECAVLSYISGSYQSDWGSILDFDGAPRKMLLQAQTDFLMPGRKRILQYCQRQYYSLRGGPHKSHVG